MRASTLREVASTFLRLGCLSFGGPIAHLGYLRVEVVERRRWLDDAHFADLVALCQFLPGPASSQVVFAVGMQRAGLLGALVASTCFTLPSVLLMIGFAYGVSSQTDLRGAGWLDGLKLSALAVVAQAVWAMGHRLCTDGARRTLAVLAAAVVLVAPHPALQVGVIALGALTGLRLFRGSAASPAAAATSERLPLGALAAWVAFFGLLAGLPVLASVTGLQSVAVFDAFYRSGALVFGGGHVVLPLLRAELVPPGWLSDEQFLAGYGFAQAVPGPLFTFSSYLGAVMKQPASWLHGLFCTFAIFLPAWLLVGGALPLWNRLRTKPWAQASLTGANAAVVGVLLAALYQPVFTESVRGPKDLALALAAFGALEWWKTPPWLVVLAMAAAGQWLR